jgi:hypothetical protein
VVAFLLAIAGAIILGYTFAYWRFGGHGAGHGGMPALFAAVGTLSTVQGPDLTTTTIGLIAVSQELIDLVFLSGVVTVALGRIKH